MQSQVVCFHTQAEGYTIIKPQLWLKNRVDRLRLSLLMCLKEGTTLTFPLHIQLPSRPHSGASPSNTVSVAWGYLHIWNQHLASKMWWIHSFMQQIGTEFWCAILCSRCSDSNREPDRASSAVEGWVDRNHTGIQSHHRRGSLKKGRVLAGCF